jgi:hypothetical protein
MHLYMERLGVRRDQLRVSVSPGVEGLLAALHSDREPRRKSIGLQRVKPIGFSLWRQL